MLTRRRSAQVFATCDAPALRVEASADDSAKILPDKTAKYQVTVVNTRTDRAVQGIGLRVVMPAGVSFVTSSVSPRLTATINNKVSTLPSRPVLNGSELTWYSTPLAARSQRTFTISYRITSDAPPGTQLMWQSFTFQTAIADLPYW